MLPCSARLQPGTVFLSENHEENTRRRRADISHSFRIKYRWRLRHHCPPGKQPWAVHVPHTKHTCRYSHILYVCWEEPISAACSKRSEIRHVLESFPPRRSGLRNHRVYSTGLRSYIQEMHGLPYRHSATVITLRH